MDKNNKTKGLKKDLDFSVIPISSSLGLLAYGDIAFKAWRKLKIETREKENE